MTRLLLSIAIVFALARTFAESVTPRRLSTLPAAEQLAWKAYLDRSQLNAQADLAAVQGEVVANKMTDAVRAPSGGDFRLSARPGDAWYASDEARQLADVVLSYQTTAGGWSKHTGYGKGPRQAGMQWTSQNEPGQRPHYVATFDNGATTEELYFLAQVWHATKSDECKAGFIRGLNFILAAQFPNGGWPQVYPLEGGYHDDITFNDDAMTHILELLHHITINEPCYTFLNPAQRQQSTAAMARGIRCVLETQIVQNGKRTGWCSQFDPLTLQPASARQMEPATLGGPESAHILKFLMTITNPAPEVVACVESGLKWLDDVQITGVGKTNVNGRTLYTFDPDSTEVYWARFYNLTNSQPVFPGRDGILYDTFEAMAAKNKLGYDYYTSQPGSILKNGQKKWRQMLASQTKK